MNTLREGFTTGSCAAAAALACCLRLRDGECPRRVELTVPEGRRYTPDILAHPDGSCGVIKDSGDDPDTTNGMEVVASVRLTGGDGDIQFAAGEGVGTVTEPGLKIPVGEPAINPVPRAMITDAVRSVFPTQAALVKVSVPGGREKAEKTFNPRLGIRGGLSILGTSGIVRPMSAEALRDSLYTELKMRVAQGHTPLGFTFGNQGETALNALFPSLCIVQVSNELGFMLDSARELGVEHILLGGHPGKLAKVAGGVMQTHSKTADARRETIVCHLALMGAERELLEKVYACVTTDAAMTLIHAAGYDAVWMSIAAAAKRYCEARTFGQMRVDVFVLDSAGKLLGSAESEAAT